MSEQAEKDRLHDIVFEGAPDNTRYIAMDLSGLWYEFSYFPIERYKDWYFSRGKMDKCKNQPETALDWTETLLERKS